MIMHFIHSKKSFMAGIASFAVALTLASADDSDVFLPHIHRHVTLTSTVPDNGDLNPYALIVAPVSAGKRQEGDVLVDNFNKITNLQGTGTTIIDYSPASKKTSVFAEL